jgi:CheY-like chemotaxis protein
MGNKDFAKLTILIAEDDINNYILLKEVIKPLGFNHLWARTGKEVIEMLTLYHVSLVLMDINMPEMDGITATCLIRKTNPVLPIIFQTACTGIEIEKTCRDAGGNELICKPLSVNTIRDVCKKYLCNN